MEEKKKRRRRELTPTGAQIGDRSWWRSRRLGGSERVQPQPSSPHYRPVGDAEPDGPQRPPQQRPRPCQAFGAELVRVKTCSRLPLPPAYRSRPSPRQIPETTLSIGYAGNMQCHILSALSCVPLQHRQLTMTNKNPQGRAIAVGNSRLQAGCHSGCRLCLLRARLPAPAADPKGPPCALSLRYHLLLFHEETARRHAVPEKRQKGLCRDRNR